MLSDDPLELLHRQYGLLSRRQSCDLEPDRNKRRTLYRQPELCWASPRVLRHRAVPWSVEQELMLGVLDAGAGAVLWGKSAACHWGFGRFRRLPAHVAVPRRTLADNHVGEIHVLRHFDERDHTMHLDIPIARPEAVVLWLAGMWTHRFGHEVAIHRTEVALDHAWRQRLIDGPFIHGLADRSGGCGRSGIVALRAVLEDRPPGYAPAGSRLEERFEETVPSRVRKHLRRQVTVDAESVIRIVDYEVRAWPLVVEINGEAFHSSLTDRVADNERYERLLQLGYSVVVFWEYDIWNDPSTVRAAMAALVAKRDEVPTLHRPTRAPWEW